MISYLAKNDTQNTHENPGSTTVFLPQTFPDTTLPVTDAPYPTTPPETDAPIPTTIPDTTGKWVAAKVYCLEKYIFTYLGEKFGVILVVHRREVDFLSSRLVSKTTKLISGKCRFPAVAIWLDPFRFQFNGGVRSSPSYWQFGVRHAMADTKVPCRWNEIKNPYTAMRM